MIWRWKMPIMRDCFRFLGRSEQTWYIPSSLPLFGFITLSLSSPRSHLFVTLAVGWKSKRWADRDRIRCLSASSGRAWQSSAFSRGVKQRVTRSRNCRTRCKSVHPHTSAHTHTHIPPLIVPAIALCLTTWNPPITVSSFASKNCLKNKKKPSSNISQSTSNKLLSLVYCTHRELKGDKSKKAAVCPFVRAKGGAGAHAGQTQVDFLSDTISSSFVAAVRQMVLPGSSFNTHRCANRHSSTHTPVCSVKDHTSFHYPSSVLYNNIRWGNNHMLSQNISSGISAHTAGQCCQVSSFLVKLSLHFLSNTATTFNHTTWYFW